MFLHRGEDNWSEQRSEPKEIKEVQKLLSKPWTAYTFMDRFTTETEALAFSMGAHDTRHTTHSHITHKYEGCPKSSDFDLI